jgi:hypothetical protein
MITSWLSFLVETNGDGKAYVAPWLIKLFAGAMLSGGIWWVTSMAGENTQQGKDIASLKTKLEATTGQLDTQQHQLDRIEAKLDGLVLSMIIPPARRTR